MNKKELNPLQCLIIMREPKRLEVQSSSLSNEIIYPINKILGL